MPPAALGYFGKVAARCYPNQWVLADATLDRYPSLYGIGPRALSTWRAKLARAIRDQPPITQR